jgi:hypothetical protein
MNPTTLKDNGELYEYLVQLAQELRERDCPLLAEELGNASRFASGSASEFLHEAQLALTHVARERPKELSSSQLEDVDAVIAQIKGAFQKIGGA